MKKSMMFSSTFLTATFTFACTGQVPGAETIITQFVSLDYIQFLFWSELLKTCTKIKDVQHYKLYTYLVLVASLARSSFELTCV